MESVRICPARRPWFCAWTWLLLALGPGGIAAPAAGAQEGRRPNVVLVFVDDLDAESMAVMPSVQALREEGATLTNHFLSFPLCNPSRATLLRGQYAHNTDVTANLGPEGGFYQYYKQNHHRNDLARFFREAGYLTAFVGKYVHFDWLPRWNYVPPYWNAWTDIRGGQYQGYWSYSYVDWDAGDEREQTSQASNPAGHRIDFEADMAVAYLEQAIAQAEPFFLFVAPFAPHLPQVAPPTVMYPERYGEAFLDATIPRVPSFNEADVSDKPIDIANQSLMSQATIDRIDRDYRNRLRSLLAVDDMVRRIVETLSEAGQLDDTYLFFTSDNGYLLGEHRIASNKLLPYDVSIRVPVVVRGPGVARGAVRDGLVMNVDFAPTVLDLIGAEVPAFMDGESYAPLLEETPPGRWRDAVLIESWGETMNVGQVIRGRYEAVRTADYLYAEWETGDREFYDYRLDPYELENAYEAMDPDLRDGLAATLDSLRHCAGRECWIGPSLVALPAFPVDDALRLDPPRPNPSGPGETTFSWALTQGGPVRLAVIDPLGREVALLRDGWEPAGAHALTMRLPRLPAGSYLVRLTTAAGDHVRPFTLLPR